MTLASFSQGVSLGRWIGLHCFVARREYRGGVTGPTFQSTAVQRSPLCVRKEWTAVIPRRPSLCSAPLARKLSEWKHFLPTGVAPAPPAEVRCPALVTPGQGTMSCRHRLGTFGLNTTCYFGCKAGFTLLGDSALSCRPSGQWTAATPACGGKMKGGAGPPLPAQVHTTHYTCRGNSAPPRGPPHVSAPP